MFKGVFFPEREAPAGPPVRQTPKGDPGDSAGGSSSEDGRPQAPGAYHGGMGLFDPSGLERAVDILRGLPNFAPSVAAEVKKQQTEAREKQTAARTKVAEMKEAIRTLAGHVRQVTREEEARYHQERRRQDKAREEYRDQLARQRDADAMELKRIEREKQERRQEELAAREDAIRRETLEYEASLRQQTELARVKAETEGRILAERENHDIRLEQTRELARESRKTLLEGIALAGETVGKGLKEFLGNSDEMTAAVVTMSAVALGIYAARTSTGVAGRFIEARLGRPSLVRETSRASALQQLRHPVKALQRAFRRPDAVAALGGGAAGEPRAIFFPQMENRLLRIAESTANTKRNRAPYRHLLLHGPPGTGKTLFAKGLAKHSGLDYAIMTGGDVAPLGRSAVTEVHKVFDWARTSRRGVLLFVDEADAFLRRRATETASEDQRNALNAFLYRTGEQSDRFMVVYASNQPEQFDEAINDRIDEMVLFELPGEEERYRMLTSYMNQYLLSPLSTAGRGGALAALLGRGAAAVTVRGVEESHIREAAVVTAGFSGREISKLAIAWQAAGYGSDDCVFGPELMREVLADFMVQKATKQQWDAEAAERFVANHHDDVERSGGQAGNAQRRGGGYTAEIGYGGLHPEMA